MILCFMMFDSGGFLALGKGLNQIKTMSVQQTQALSSKGSSVGSPSTTDGLPILWNVATPTNQDATHQL